MKEDKLAREARPRLANSPLVEAVFEVRFPGNFAVLNRLGEFQSAVEKEFPNLFVPATAVGADGSLTPYRFVSADQAEILHIAVNRFALAWRRYTVFDAFRRRFLELFGQFTALAFAPKTFTRMGLRFMNVLPEMECSVRKFHPWLNLGLDAPTLGPGRAEQITGSLTLVYPEGRLRILVGNEPTNLQTLGFPTNALAGTFALDLDFYTGESVSASRLEWFMDAAHTRVDDAFFGLVTGEALAILGGEL